MSENEEAKAVCATGVSELGAAEDAAHGHWEERLSWTVRRVCAERDAARAEASDRALDREEALSELVDKERWAYELEERAAVAEDELEDVKKERDAAIARAAEEQAERCGLEEQLSEAERRRDELRAEVARLQSERAGLRHSLTEVEDELEECRKERDEARTAVEARVRELEARGFEQPEPGAYTCGDALGLRRLP